MLKLCIQLQYMDSKIKNALFYRLYMYMRISFFIFKIIKGIFAKNHNIVKNDRGLPKIMCLPTVS